MRNNYFETEWGADERGDGGAQGGGEGWTVVTKIEFITVDVALNPRKITC